MQLQIAKAQLERLPRFHVAVHVFGPEQDAHCILGGRRKSLEWVVFRRLNCRVGRAPCEPFRASLRACNRDIRLETEIRINSPS